MRVKLEATHNLPRGVRVVLIPTDPNSDLLRTIRVYKHDSNVAKEIKKFAKGDEIDLPDEDIKK